MNSSIEKQEKSRFLPLVTLFLVFLTISSFIFTLSITNGIFRYSMTSIKAIVIMISLSLLCFSLGLIMNQEKIYKNNIKLYIGLYLLLLFSITFFIARPSFLFDWDNVFHIYEDSLIPFRTISRYFSGRASIRTFLYNIVGNIVLFLPFSFLLMIKNKKYNNILRQLVVLLPLIVGIEIFQEITSVGSFEVDDMILNIFGALVFTFLITRFNFIDKIRHWFYSSWKGMFYFKYLLYIISSIVPIWFMMQTIIKLIRYLC